MEDMLLDADPMKILAFGSFDVSASGDFMSSSLTFSACDSLISSDRGALLSTQA